MLSAVVDVQPTAVEPEVDERRLYWVGPMTVVAATLAVWMVQHICLFILPPLPAFSGRILSSIEPALFTAVLVTLAVFVFGWVAEMASRPLRTFRRIALGALIVSCLPNVLGPIMARVLDLGLLALGFLHVVAWAVTVPMLTRLTIRKIR